MRKDVYMTRCGCKKRFFERMTDAKEHHKNCDTSHGVYYNAPYGEPIRMELNNEIKKVSNRGD